MQVKSKVLVAAILFINSGVTWSASCEEYPYTDGTTIESVGENNFKILSTYSASVNFDDDSAIRDAREEAQIQAKAQITAFLEETVKSEKDINKVVDESVTMQGKDKSVTRTEVKQTLQHLSQSSQGLLRGVVPLGDCYTKSKEVRVTVGIKPETIAQAENLAGGISKSLSAQPSTTNSNESVGDQTTKPLNGSDGFSHTEKLKNF